MRDHCKSHKGIKQDDMIGNDENVCGQKGDMSDRIKEGLWITM